MLVLSRKRHEAIVIGDNITVIVSAIRDGKVYLAIDAPKDVRVDRSEVSVKRKVKMNFKLTIDDARRLLPANDFETLQRVYGDKLADVLANAEQPPEMGIASEDKYLQVMLAGVYPLGRFSA